MSGRTPEISDRDASYKGGAVGLETQAAPSPPMLFQAWAEVLMGIRAPMTLHLGPGGVATMLPWWAGLRA